TSLGSGTLTPIRVATSTAGPTINVGKAPADLVITPDGKTAYVLHSVLSLTGTVPGWITPVNLATGTSGTPIPVGLFPLDIAITPSHGIWSRPSIPAAGECRSVITTAGSMDGPAGPRCSGSAPMSMANPAPGWTGSSRRYEI